MPLSVTYGPQIWYNAIVAMGATPGSSDLQREDAYLLLQKQWLDLVTGQLSPAGNSTRVGVYQTITANSDVKSAYTAEVAFLTAAGAQLITSFPANSLSFVGRTVRVTAWGVATAKAATTPAFRHQIRLGGVAGRVINASLLQATGAGAAGAQWIIQGEFVVRTAGAAGIIQPSVRQSQQNDATTRVVDASAAAIGTGAQPAAIDLTVAQVLVITTECDTNDAGNTDTLEGCIVEVLR